jgi:hypothetical protein
MTGVRGRETRAQLGDQRTTWLQIFLFSREVKNRCSSVLKTGRENKAVLKNTCTAIVHRDRARRLSPKCVALEIVSPQRLRRVSSSIKHGFIQRATWGRPNEVTVRIARREFEVTMRCEKDRENKDFQRAFVTDLSPWPRVLKVTLADGCDTYD